MDTPVRLTMIDGESIYLPLLPFTKCECLQSNGIVSPGVSKDDAHIIMSYARLVGKLNMEEKGSFTAVKNFLKRKQYNYIFKKESLGLTPNEYLLSKVNAKVAAGAKMRYHKRKNNHASVAVAASSSSSRTTTRTITIQRSNHTISSRSKRGGDKMNSDNNDQQQKVVIPPTLNDFMNRLDQIDVDYYSAKPNAFFDMVRLSVENGSNYTKVQLQQCLHQAATRLVNFEGIIIQEGPTDDQGGGAGTATDKDSSGRVCRPGGV